MCQGAQLAYQHDKQLRERHGCALAGGPDLCRCYSSCVQCCEHLTAEILDLLSICDDEELDSLIKATFPSGGVIPSHP
uniref:Histone H2A C-terminal domain-containing protein n=1 Tax=Salvator merianae TaxID=96440 RepID=A0A8D0DTW1_SALMN